MSESEFDKQVQREMEGLRLRPSAAVWENVEKELRRKKRRRVLVFFWLLAGISLLGYSGYYFTQKGKSSLAESSYAPGGATAGKAGQPAGEQSTRPPGNPTAGTLPADPGSGGQAVEPSSPMKETTAAGTAADAPAANNTLDNKDPETNAGNKTIQQPTSGTSDQFAAISASGDKRSRTKKTTVRKNQPPAAIEGALVSGTRKKNKAKPVVEEPAAKATGTEQVSQADQQVAAAPQTAPVSPIVSQDSVKAGADSAVAAIAPAPAEAKVPQLKKKPSSKIKWSLDLGFGLSGPISSPFLIGSANKSNTDPPQQNANFPTSPITPPGSFGPVYTPRSDINPGPSFRVGILGEWAISKRSSIATGLQYLYQSNNIRTGYYTDTSVRFDNYASQPVSVNSLYRGGSQKTFTNRYHYLQVPVNFQWQVNAGKKLPIILNAGIAAGYLLTTNALAYDSLQGGVYYHDKNAFNRFQFTFHTGLAFRFGNNKVFQWSIGPEVSMGLRSQVKEEYDKKQYPLYLGVQGRVYWPRKRVRR